MEKTENVEIDLIDLFFYLKKRIALIAAAVAIAAVVGFVVTQLFIPNEYTASTRMYVLNRSNDNNVVYSDFQASTQMLKDYKVLITGVNVTDKVIAELGLKMSSGQLAKAISVTAPDDTRVVQISVVDRNPQQAADIANAVYRIASQQIREIMDVDAVSLVYAAKVPTSPSAPSVTGNTFISALLGAVISIGALVVVYVLDDTIRTEEDVERYLGLGTLGVIPVSAELGTANKTKKNSLLRLKLNLRQKK